jgi:hypothetical protein
MVGSEHSRAVVDEEGERFGGGVGVPCLALPAGEVVPGGQGLRMVGAEDPEAVVEEFLERIDGAAGVTVLPSPVGQIVPGGQRMRMIRS